MTGGCSRTAMYVVDVVGLRHGGDPATCDPTTRCLRLRLGWSGAHLDFGVSSIVYCALRAHTYMRILRVTVLIS